MHKIRCGFGRLCAGLVLSGAALTAQAEWELDAAESSLFYVTSKASAISEVNTFTRLSGAITDDGTATLVIDLTSVDTGIEIRNERMQEIVFEVEAYPAAIVTVTVDPMVLNEMMVGKIEKGTYPAVLDLHGTTQEMDASLQITKLDADSIEVQTVRPVLVSAGNYGLAAAVEELREIAGLPSINPTIVVNFSLVYHKM